jgi:hypothetical protein
MADSLALLNRLLKSADLPKIVPRLQPHVLHRAIQTWGLEDCADVVALATPNQLTHVLDSDIWRVRAHGADEELDPERFGLWISVLMQAGAEVAAEKLIGLDIELVIAGLTDHVRVFEDAAVSEYTTLDGLHVPRRQPRGDFATEIGGYVIEARRSSAWDSVFELLVFLEEAHEAFFHRLMRGCVRSSNGRREEDGFYDLPDDDEEQRVQAAHEREARREQLGYLTPAQAQAFLQEARALDLAADPPARSNVARAYFRAIGGSPLTEGEPFDVHVPDASDPASPALRPHEPDEGAEIVAILQEAGVLASAPRALLGAGDGPSSRLSLIREHVAAHPASGGELAFLSNVLLAGCSIQERPFTPREASDGAAACCNLGLDGWPARWPERDLVTAFQVGWTMLYREVCLDTAERLIAILSGIRCRDRETRLRLDGLRHALIRGLGNGRPWSARNALDVLIVLDAPSWAAVLGLIDECPVLHAALTASRRSRRGIDPAAFEFISQRSQLAVVHEFVSLLPGMLTS